MKVDQIIKLVRRRVMEVDPATSAYTDPDILERIGDTLVILKTQNVKGFNDPVNPLVLTMQPPAITPEPADETGVIAAYRTAVDILKDEFQQRLKEGSLGVSWTSGVDSESSTLAAKAYQDRITSMEDELDRMIMIQTPLTVARVQ